MRVKEKQIKFYCTVDEFEKINSHASKFNLATGTYLRLLGLLGPVPYVETKGQQHPRIVMEARGYEGLEAQLLDRDESKQDRHKKHSA